MRIKERTSFKIAWMRIDLTAVQTYEGNNAQPNQSLEYEIEMEICDPKYLITNLRDAIVFKKIVRKFIIN